MFVAQESIRNILLVSLSLYLSLSLSHNLYILYIYIYVYMLMKTTANWNSFSIHSDIQSIDVDEFSIIRYYFFDGVWIPPNIDVPNISYIHLFILMRITFFL